MKHCYDCEARLLAKQIEGVYEKLYECAVKEFMEKGFKDASLRVIAQEAGTSTGSIYTRFGDKEGLFRAIVQPAADEVKAMFLSIQEAFHALDADTQRQEMGSYAENEMEHLIDLLYDHFDAFRLLLDASYGTLYQNFVNELVDIEVEYTYKFMQTVGIKSKRAGQLSQELLHMVMTAWLNGVFEVVRHEMPREDAKQYVRMLDEYHRAGFERIFMDIGR